MTELIWDGKYDAAGKKVGPPRIALPFQTVETVNEGALERHRTLDMFATGQPSEWRNRLIWGDKKYVLPSLLNEFAGQVNLIYIDPPFDTGANFSYMATVPDDPSTPGDQGATFVKEPSVIEQKAYRDTWGKGLDSYLKWFYETVVLLRELLAEDGSIYVHLDYHVAHYAKAVLDEVFGADNFRNEIIWQRTTNTGSSKGLANKLSADTDTIFYVTKSSNATFNKLYRDYSDDYLSRFKYEDANGMYRWQYMATYSQAKLKELEGKDMMRWPTGAKNPEYKQYLDDLKGIPLNNLWTDIFHINPMAHESLDYPTQKPEALLERILNASSNEGDLVLDCFCGSGTTAAVAEKLNRRWITCDLGRFAIHTARKRLLGIENVKPFIVQNLGKYERQAWQTAEFGDKAEAVAQTYRSFILSLYRAQPLSGYIWLHGVRNGRMVHVGDVAAPISEGDVREIAKEFKRMVGTGKDAPTQSSVDILGWDFAFELNEVAQQQAALAGIAVRFIRIPREVLEKKAVEQGDIKFFELAALSVKCEVVKMAVRLELTGFIIPLDDVPHDIQKAITHWEQWIDYWAVDWDNKGDTFHNQWQAYRTRKDKTLQRTIASPPGTYTAPGEYRIMVKVIDILGNDTTKTMRVEIA